MPKLGNSLVALTLFTIDGLNYGRNQYQYVYNNVQYNDGVLDESVIEVGLFSRDEQKYLVQPTPVNTWMDTSDFVYTDLEALVSDIEKIVGMEI